MEEGGPGSEMECIIIEVRVEDVIRELTRCNRRGRSTKKKLISTTKALVAWGDLSNGYKELFHQKEQNGCRGQQMQRARPDTPTYSPSGSEGEAADLAALDVGADGAGWSASPRWYVPATGDGYSPPYSPPSSPGTDAPISPVVPGAAAALASQSLHPSPVTGAAVVTILFVSICIGPACVHDSLRAHLWAGRVHCTGIEVHSAQDQPRGSDKGRASCVLQVGCRKPKGVARSRRPQIHGLQARGVQQWRRVGVVLHPVARLGQREEAPLAGCGAVFRVV